MADYGCKNEKDASEGACWQFYLNLSCQLSSPSALARQTAKMAKRPAKMPNVLRSENVGPACGRN
jgi:hypothetical protein